MHISERPPIGFVVEGKGEWASYPSLVARITGASFNVPRVKADGFGDVLRNLHEHLDDLVAAHRPLTAIVTVDLADGLKAGDCTSCRHLKGLLEESATAWLTARRSSPKHQPLPARIVIVIQIRKFETWWLADLEGLDRHPLFEIQAADGWKNVDEEGPEPCGWLKGRMTRPMDIKSPTLAKEVISQMSPQVMRGRSPSFDKFHREVDRGYNEWLQLLAEVTSSG